MRLFSAFILMLICAGLGWPEAGALAQPVVMNELMYHPDSGNVSEEYIELFNPGPEPVNLLGWRFSSGITFEFPDRSIPAGGYLVVAADEQVFAAKYPGVTHLVGGWQGRLRNSDESIVLRDGEGRVIDRVRYADQGDWAIRQRGPLDLGHRGWKWFAAHDGLGKSLELIQWQLPHDCGQNWAASAADGGTPGRANSMSQTNAAPFILDLTHAPRVPASTNAVAVTARILDESPGTVTVLLHYRNHSTLSPPGFAALPMLDDGRHADGLAGDAIFGAVLPPHPPGSSIEFYVAARDELDNQRTCPAPALDEHGTPVQAANALFLVDDAVYHGDQPILRLVLTETERSELENIDRYSDAEMNATLITDDGVNGEVRYNVGLRIRGGSSRKWPVPNYRVNVPTDRRWQGVVALNLNIVHAHAQLMGSLLSCQAGLVGPDARAVQVRVNGVNLAQRGPVALAGFGFGAYALFEVVDADWAENHFPLDPDGNIYFARYHNSDLSFLGTQWQDYAAHGYSKESNQTENDWSDLIQLTAVLSTTAESAYPDQVRRVLDPLAWARYFAVNAVLGNNESSLATGVGDDYDLYRGVQDPRFLLVPHDWDSILEPNRAAPVNAGLFRATALPAVDRFLKHPSFVPLYYSELLRLVDTALSPAQMDPLLDRFLGGHVPAGAILAMKEYAAARAHYIRSQIPLQLTITNSLPSTNGLFVTTQPQIVLSGRANPVRTRRVRVDGSPAEWTAWQASWTNRYVPLLPGLNRIVVEALGEHDQVFEQGTVRIFRNTGWNVWDDVGALATNTVWTASGGPYYVSGRLIVPAGKTLTLREGTTVFFAPDALLAVHGRLWAEGSDRQPLHFSAPPGAAGSWGGIQIDGSTNENRLANAVLEHGGPAALLDVRNATVSLEDLVFVTQHTCLSFSNASLVVRSCSFPRMQDCDAVLGQEVPAGGELVFAGNHFGGTSGSNALIQFTGAHRPGPILQILDNVFEFGTDAGAALHAADAHIEGNLFRHIHRDAPGPSLAGGIVADDGSEIVVARNIFSDCDNGVILQEDSFGTLVNNVITGSEETALVLGGVNPLMDPARGAYLDGSILWNNRAHFGGLEYSNGPSPELTVHRSILQGIQWPGTGNQSLDPMFVDPTNDFRLRPGSPALGTGPNGLDMGAHVPGGISVSGEPPLLTSENSTTLTLGGPGYDNPGIGDLTNYYRYRLNDGPWSQPQLLATPLRLTNLVNETYTVYAVGQNSAGVWQDTQQATPSKTWTVQARLPGLRINEILAVNASASNHSGSFPDLIELYNAGRTSVDLSALRLTDHPANPGKFTLPAGLFMGPNEYLVLLADQPNGTPGIHLGFSLKREGEGLYLFDAVSRGGGLLDQVTFGLQQPDLAIGRLHDGTWGLTLPTFGGENQPARVGDPAGLRITEWLAKGASDDFVEVYNPEPVPVALGGLFWTDNPWGWPDRHLIPPLSFIGAQSYLAFVADGNPEAGADHLNFSLAYEQGMIALLDPDRHVIDSILYGPQQVGVSEGRIDPHSEETGFFPELTPGASNANIPPQVVITAPLSGQEMALPNDIALSASAWDQDGRVLQVAFYQGDLHIGDVTEAPYTLVWSNVSPGTHTITARACDDLGACRNSYPVTINPPRPRILLSEPVDGSAVLQGESLSMTAVMTNAPWEIDRVEFYNDGAWLAQDAESPYQTSWVFVPRRYALQAVARFDGGFSITSSVVTVGVLQTLPAQVTWVATNTFWKYLDTGADLGEGWRDLDYADDHWPSGQAQLGYGEGDEATTVGFGPDPNNKFITTYFRHWFLAGAYPGWSNVTARLLRGDGAIVYLNGEEIIRSNLPEGPVDYRTLATSNPAPENAFLSFPVDPAHLRPGTNLLAVEVHLEQGQTDAMSFALELTGQQLLVEPWIVRQQPDLRVAAGAIALLEVVPAGQPLWLQWFRESGQLLPGETGPDLLLPEVHPTQAGGYFLVISNQLGTVTSRVARVTVQTLDSDADGMADYWENKYGLNPEDGTDASLDHDGDGMINSEEYKRRLDPQRVNPALHLTPLLSPNTVTGALIQFVALSNTTYRVEAMTNTTTCNWQALQTEPAGPSNRWIEIVTPVTRQPRFFRLRTLE